jgi:L-ascorbate metabolism protein UlaG (beta-lactamase superfamily)
MATACSITYIGGPTVLIEIDGLRLLTDPTFDSPGEHYNFGLPFIGATKIEAPAIELAELGPVDAVLLSHDQHQDNLDTRGRDALTVADRVLTTTAGSKRLGGNAEGLRPWESTVLGDDRRRITVTALPARHGAAGISLLSGPAIGFMLEWAGQEHGGLYVSGDTVYFGGIDKIARRLQVSVAVLHLGGVRFAASGPAQYTFDAAGGLRATRALKAHAVVPIHLEGWSHFRTPRSEIDAAFAAAGLADRLRWPVTGQPLELEV